MGFYFESHGSYYGPDTGPGWYIDDIVVTSVTPPTGIVEFTDARYFVNEGNNNATITTERKFGGAGAVDVYYVATDGTAMGGMDFESVVDMLSWTNGEQGVKTFTVPITQDALCEGNETVTLQLVVPGEVASSVAREEATLVIIDDECPVVLATNIAYLRSLVGTTNWVPTNTSSLFTVDGTVTTYANLSTAAADELFFMQDGTNGIAVLFRGGANQFMPQAGDRLRVTAALTNINGLLALAPNYVNLTNVVWPLSHSNALPTPLALNFTGKTNVATMEATEARYVSASQVTIDQTGGSTFPTVLTNLVVTNQAGQSFSLTIRPNADIGGKAKPTGPVTILGVLNQNDPTAPYTTNYALLPTRYADIISAPDGKPGVLQMVTTSLWVSEAGGAVALNVSRTGGSNGAVSVSFACANSTALAGVDYTATNGVLSWANNEAGTKTIVIPVLNDTAEEPDETFTVALSSPTGGAALFNAVATVAVVNDDYYVQPATRTVVQGSTTSFSITPSVACSPSSG